jgi:orotidine-5'-phosphate decarboxylase
MNADQLFEQIKAKQSFLCVGLDTDANKLPLHMAQKISDANDQMVVSSVSKMIFEFNKAIIDATAPYTVAYKPNLAFYEAFIHAGVKALALTCAYIKVNYPEIFIIADAKRGDIGNTSELYAKAFLGGYNLFDAITLSPYMGKDTVEPFFNHKDKWAIILALTSNPSAADFEMQKLANGKYLYEQVLETSKEWGTTDNTMYVVGATKAEMLAGIRKIVPNHFLLVPGVGAQGGSLSEVAKYGMNSRCGLLVNSSRGIIYADKTERFAEVAGEKAKEMRDEMAELLQNIPIR